MGLLTKKQTADNSDNGKWGARFSICHLTFLICHRLSFLSA